MASSVTSWPKSKLSLEAERRSESMTRQLTNDEQLELRAFHRQVDRLRKSSIGQQRKAHVSVTTNFDFRTGQITASSKGYDPESFQSQLPVLRQFILNDPVNFGHICN